MELEGDGRNGSSMGPQIVLLLGGERKEVGPEIGLTGHVNDVGLCVNED